MQFSSAILIWTLCQNLIGAYGIDHINPKLWIGNVWVGDVDLEQEYFAGWDEANNLLVEHFGDGKAVDFDVLFFNPKIDHFWLQKKYIGFQVEGVMNDADLEFAPPNLNDDTDIVKGVFGNATESESNSIGRYEGYC